VKQPFTFNQFITMMPSHKTSGYLYQITTGENGVGSDGEGRRESEKEQWINGVRDGLLVRNENSMGQE
jgi:hypothetical protein